MSDSDLSDAPVGKVPANNVLEKALRKETAKQFEAPLKSINSIRKGAEEFLGLETGFFADHHAWKARSKEIIKTELEVLENAAEPSSSPVLTKNSPAKPKGVQPKTKAASQKRTSPAIQKPPPKRQKKSLPEENSGAELSSPPTEDSDAKAKARVKTKPKPRTKETPQAKAPKQSQGNGKAKAEHKSKSKSTSKPKSKNQDSDSPASDPPDGDSESIQAPDNASEDSDSELSVLMDEAPRPKTKQKGKVPSGGKAATKAKPAVEDDPDQEEIKRLQGWLVKCGIRKIWAFELKPYETPKAKIKHLKNMLSDVGMTGRFSLEKASQIKEARELAADIEAVQEGNEIWGMDGEDRSRRSKRGDRATTEDDVDEEDGAAPAKKLIRGPKRYDFLSSDGEESD